MSDYSLCNGSYRRLATFVVVKCWHPQAPPHRSHADHLGHHPSTCALILQVRFSVWIVLQLWGAVQRCPFGLVLEQSHSFDVLFRQRLFP